MECHSGHPPADGGPRFPGRPPQRMHARGASPSAKQREAGNDRRHDSLQFPLHGVHLVGTSRSCGSAGSARRFLSGSTVTRPFISQISRVCHSLAWRRPPSKVPGRDQTLRRSTTAEARSPNDLTKMETIRVASERKGIHRRSFLLRPALHASCATNGRNHSAETESQHSLADAVSFGLVIPPGHLPIHCLVLLCDRIPGEFGHLRPT